VNDHVITSKNGFNGTTGSLSFWVFIGAANTGYSFSYRVGSSNQLRVQGNASLVDFVTYDASTLLRRISTAIASGVWNHVAWTWRSGTFTIFINGVDSKAVASGSGSGVVDYSLANSFYLGGQSGNSFTGKLEDVRIYNRALSANEIALLARRRNIAYERKPLTMPLPAATGNRRRRVLIGS